MTGATAVRTLSILAVFLFIATCALADEPPSWSDFEVVSGNGDYVAKITANDSGGHTLSVYYRDRGVLYWSDDYVYDGYTWGILSSDGSTFAYVNFWFYDDEPVVYMYREGKVRGHIEGGRFGIPRSRLKDTVSHRLWLCEECPEHYRFTYPRGGNPILEVETIDGRRHRLVLGGDGRISIGD